MIDGASAHEASIVHPYKKEDLSEMVGFRGLAFINNRRGQPRRRIQTLYPPLGSPLRTLPSIDYRNPFH
jgi:hypothetical protein